MRKIPQVGEEVDVVSRQYIGTGVVVELEVGKCNRTFIYVQDWQRRIWKLSKEELEYSKEV